MEDCLTNLFKLSRTTCECYDTDKPTDYNEGKADVYLDELEGMNLDMVKAVSDCSSGSLWSILAWAREEAAKQFKADLLACIGTNYSPRRPVYSGLVGQSSFTGSLALTKAFAGVKYTFPTIKGGVATIKRIGMAFNVSTPITVDVYNNDENSTNPIATYTINTTANTLIYASLATPLDLPMWSNNVSRLEYYFVYSRAGFQPKDNKADCGCGGVPAGWKSWMSVNGIEGNGTDYTGYGTSAHTNGIILDVDLRCQTSELICSDDRPLDFENEGWDMQVVYANRWLAGALAFQKFLDSPNLNRYTMMDREKTYGMRNHARKKYNDFIAYLCDNKEISSGCLKCRPNANFTMGNITA